MDCANVKSTDVQKFAPHIEERSTFVIAIVRALLVSLMLYTGLSAPAYGADKITPDQVAKMSDRLQADITDRITPDQVARMSDRLEADIASIQMLDALIEGASDHDMQSLLYRRDDRSFKLLLNLDKLAQAASTLPEDNEVRASVAIFLGEGLGGVGKGVLQRTSKLTARIAEQRVMLTELSGADLVVAEAKAESLENLRMRYYVALVTLIERRKEFGLSDGTLSGDLLPMLYLQAETLTGRIKYTGGALDELNERIVEDTQNADLAVARNGMARQQELDLAHLEKLIDLLARLGENPAVYKEVLLAQSHSIKVSALGAGVLVSLLQSGWDNVKIAIADNAPDILFKLLLFISILLVFRYLARLVRKLVKLACERPGNDMSTLLKDVLISVCGGVVMVFGYLIALSQVGISLGPMLAGLGVAGFVIGFALQDTLGNFAAGGMILLYRPYDVDDFVEVAGASGLVKKMSLVSTTITTFDNQTLVVPNSKIWGDVIKNVTAQKVRRVDLVFGISYTDDIAKAESVLASVLEEHEKVLSTPEALVKLHELADSSVNFIVRPWVRTEDYWGVYWDITREVKMRFDSEGISIPFPQRDVHVYSQSPG